MLEVIEILRNGLPLAEPRSWLFIAAAVAAGIAGWYALPVLQHVSNSKEEE